MSSITDQDKSVFLTDLDFFEQEITRYSETLKDSLMNKRLALGPNDDPLEELSSVYSEVQTIEQDFKKAITIFEHLLGQSRDLYSKNK